MAAKGHYGAGGGTKQGVYVCTPSGQFLASINSLSPKSVKQVLERGLAAWNKLPAKDREAKPAKSTPDHRWEWSYPENGLVLKQTVRYLADDSATDQQRDSRFNFDFAWFSADEAEQFIPKTLKVGERYQVPQVIYHRFARYHLLNTAHTESGTYHAQEVNGKLFVKVLAVDKRSVRVRISGNSLATLTKSEHPGLSPPPRIEAKLLGFASFDRVARRFDSFELVAKGEIYNSTEKKPAEHPQRSIGWYFTLADPDQPFERLYPTHIHAYDADWVKKPAFALHGLQPNPLDRQKMNNVR